MSKSKFTNPFAPARLEKVNVAGQEVQKVGVMLEDDDGIEQCVGILSKGYNLIQNQVAHDVASDVMSRSDYDWKELKTMWNGRQYIAHYITTEQIGGGENLPLSVGLMVRNSIDGTGCFGMELFACNLECLNQYISRKRFGYFSIRHTAKDAFDIDDALVNVQEGAQRVIGIAPQLDQLQKEPMTIETLCQTKKNLNNFPQSKWGEVIDQLNHDKDRPYCGTMFGLFQALTFVSTHSLNGYSSLSVGDSITEHILG